MSGFSRGKTVRKLRVPVGIIHNRVKAWVDCGVKYKDRTPHQYQYQYQYLLRLGAYIVKGILGVRIIDQIILTLQKGYKVNQLIHRHHLIIVFHF